MLNAIKQQYGSSETLCDYVIKEQIAEINPKKIVDFGAGGGKIGKIAREILGEKVNLIAVEGYKKTADMLSELPLYNRVYHSRIQEWLNTNTDSYDLAIFGDVLEHLTAKEIHRVIKQSINKFEQIIIICPLYNLFQGASYGNPLEIHRTFITSNFFDRYHPAEKHIIRKVWTIMNIRILSTSKPLPLYRNLIHCGFHKCILCLQPLGLARPFVNFVIHTILKRKNMD
jgi:hypothetical protein